MPNSRRASAEHNPAFTLRDLLAWVEECDEVGLPLDTPIHARTKGMKGRLVEVTADSSWIPAPLPAPAEQWQDPKVVPTEGYAAGVADIRPATPEELRGQQE